MIQPTPCQCWLKRCAVLVCVMGLLLAVTACAEWQIYATSMAVSPRTVADPSSNLTDSRPTSTLATTGRADVCQRHEVVKSALSSALETLDGRLRPCSAMTWADLADVTSLSLQVGMGHPPLPASDLAGLTALQQLSVYYPQARPLPPDLLWEIPQLQELSLDLYYTELHYYLLERLSWLENVVEMPISQGRRVTHANLPPVFLTHSPQLRRLTIQITGAEGPIQEPFVLPSGLLAHNPELRELTIQLPIPTFGMPLALPAAFLAHNPRLELVSLQAKEIGPWPQGFLDHNPRLQFLSIRAKSIVPLPAYSQAYVTSPEEAPLLDNSGLAHTLPESLFAHKPQLQQVEIDISKLQSLSSNLFAQMPRLRHLKIRSQVMQDIPSDLLAGHQQLQAVEFYFPGVKQVPPDLFAHNPDLHQLVLSTGAKALPAELLVHNPGLQELTIAGDNSLETLPEDLLARNPELQRLELQASNRLRSLPSGLLVRNHELRGLTVRSRSMLGMSGDLLAGNPRLQRLTFSVHEKRHIPADFLSHSPQLQQLVLHIHRSGEIPENLLIHNPYLQYLHL